MPAGRIAAAIDLPQGVRPAVRLDWIATGARKVWYMMTSDELARDLRDIDRLLAALNAPHDVEDEDLEDLCWLLERQRFLSAVLAIRRAQKGRKVVDLELWRYGGALASGRAVAVA